MERKRIAICCLVVIAVFFGAAIVYAAIPPPISSDKTSTSSASTTTTTSDEVSTTTSIQQKVETTAIYSLSINVSRVYYDAADSMQSQFVRLLIYDLSVTNTGNQNLTLHSEDFLLIANTYYNGGLVGTYSFSNIGVPKDVIRSTTLNGTFSITPRSTITGQVAYQVQLNNQPTTIEYNDTSLMAYAYNVPQVPYAVSVLNYSSFSVMTNASGYLITMIPCNFSSVFENQPETGFYQGEVIALDLNVTYVGPMSGNDLVPGSITAVTVSSSQGFVESSISPSLPMTMTAGKSGIVHLFLIAPSVSYFGGLNIILTVGKSS